MSHIVTKTNFPCQCRICLLMWNEKKGNLTRLIWNKTQTPRHSLKKKKSNSTTLIQKKKSNSTTLIQDKNQTPRHSFKTKIKLHDTHWKQKIKLHDTHWKQKMKLHDTHWKQKIKLHDTHSKQKMKLHDSFKTKNQNSTTLIQNKKSNSTTLIQNKKSNSTTFIQDKNQTPRHSSKTKIKLQTHPHLTQALIQNPNLASWHALTGGHAVGQDRGLGGLGGLRESGLQLADLLRQRLCLRAPTVMVALQRRLGLGQLQLLCFQGGKLGTRGDNFF